MALSKTVSECNTLGRQNQKAKVFQVAFFAFLFMGLFSFVCMSVFSPIVAKYVLQNEKAVFAVLALSPSVLCTCICSAFRGYAQGHMNMVPTGISQVIEAVSKMFLGLALAFLILNSAIPDEDLKSRLSASGALLGVSIGSILSVAFLAFNHIRTNRRERITSNDTPDTSKQILSRLLKLAIPITLSSCTLTIVNLIDTGLVQSQLQTVFTAIQDGLTGISNSVLDIFPKAVAIFQENLAAFQAEVLTNPDTQLNPILDSARELYGVYSKTMSIYNLPFNLMVPLTACIVPGVSACIARRDRLGAQRTTESAMRISALIALPCGFGLFALGTPIIQLLTVGNVDETIAGPLLSILGIAALFVCIQVVASAHPPGQRYRQPAHHHHGDRRRGQGHRQLHPGGQSQVHDLRRPHRHPDLLRDRVGAQPLRHQAPGAPAPPAHPRLCQAPHRLPLYGGGGLGLPGPAGPVLLRLLYQERHCHRRRHPGRRGGVRHPHRGAEGAVQGGPGNDAQG